MQINIELNIGMIMKTKEKKFVQRVYMLKEKILIEGGFCIIIIVYNFKNKIINSNNLIVKKK